MAPRISPAVVQVASLPAFLRDVAKGQLVAVALDEQADGLRKSIGTFGDLGPVIESGIEAQAVIYADAAAAVRRFVGIGTEPPFPSGE